MKKTILLLFLISTIPASAQSSLSVSGVTDNRAVYPGSAIPAYSKLEISFRTTPIRQTALIPLSIPNTAGYPWMLCSCPRELTTGSPPSANPPSHTNPTPKTDPPAGFIPRVRPSGKSAFLRMLPETGNTGSPPGTVPEPPSHLLKPFLLPPHYPRVLSESAAPTPAISSSTTGHISPPSAARESPGTTTPLPIIFLNTRNTAKTAFVLSAPGCPGSTVPPGWNGWVAAMSMTVIFPALVPKLSTTRSTTGIT